MIHRVTDVPALVVPEVEEVLTARAQEMILVTAQRLSREAAVIHTVPAVELLPGPGRGNPLLLLLPSVSAGRTHPHP